MNKYLKNFYDLYSEKDEEVYKAILEKKDWILDEFYLPGDLSITKDEEGNNHFFMLENVLNDLISLNAYPFVLPTMKKESLEYKYLVLYKETKRVINPPLFWIKYDFKSIDEETYRALLANIFPRLSEEDVEIGAKTSDMFMEIMKSMMIGDAHEMVLIVQDSSKSPTIRAPKILEILYDENAPREVIETLENIAKVKGASFKEMKK